MNNNIWVELRSNKKFIVLYVCLIIFFLYHALFIHLHYFNYVYALAISSIIALVGSVPFFVFLKNKWFAAMCLIAILESIPKINDGMLFKTKTTCKIIGDFKNTYTKGRGYPRSDERQLELKCADGIRFTYIPSEVEKTFTFGDSINIRVGLLGYQRI